MAHKQQHQDRNNPVVGDKFIFNWLNSYTTRVWTLSLLVCILPFVPTLSIINHCPLLCTLSIIFLFSTPQQQQQLGLRMNRSINVIFQHIKCSLLSSILWLVTVHSLVGKYCSFSQRRENCNAWKGKVNFEKWIFALHLLVWLLMSIKYLKPVQLNNVSWPWTAAGMPWFQVWNLRGLF